VGVGAGTACRDFTGKYLSSREWNITGSDTSIQVSTALQQGVGPTLSNIAGFREYVGANTVTSADPNKPDDIFFTIYDTSAQALAATAAVASFVANGALNSQISKNQFILGPIGFHFTNGLVCTNSTLTGKFMARRYWGIFEDATMNSTTISNYFRDNLAPTFQSSDGFLEYGSVILNSTNLLFWNIFDTLDSSANANAVAATFVSNYLSEQIFRVKFTLSTVAFDITTPIVVTTSTSTTATVSGSSVLCATPISWLALIVLGITCIMFGL